MGGGGESQPFQAQPAGSQGLTHRQSGEGWPGRGRSHLHDAPQVSEAQRSAPGPLVGARSKGTHPPFTLMGSSFLICERSDTLVGWCPRPLGADFSSLLMGRGPASGGELPVKEGIRAVKRLCRYSPLSLTRFWVQLKILMQNLMGGAGWRVGEGRARCPPF